MAKKKDESTTIHIEPVRYGVLQVGIIGKTPLLCNRMSEKARHGLLNPEGPGMRRSTKAERAEAGEKHNPLEEFRSSPYTLDSDDSPTLIAMPSSSVKRAMASGALDLPGASKAQIGRLVWVPGEFLPVFGLPQLRMDVVRMANKDRTPDIRTRACLRQWAMVVQIEYVMPMLKESGIANLLEAAGNTIGIGDARQEKGALDCGRFEVVSLDDPRLAEISKMGRDVQVAALQDPTFYNDEARSLYEWWVQSVAEPVRSKNGVVAV